MPTYNAEKGQGVGGGKVYAATVQAQDTDTIDTGLSSIDGVSVTPTTDGASATVNSVSNGVITLGLNDSGGASINADEAIYIVAVGQV